ncbi:aldehyde dehydrogenase family protein [Prauserella flavalba]|uniref:Aldehyde dehydrogenase n=1 Tax=Prauserella flavalba TaxID=1477506 RepID=A0A318LX33_9PSEU|nr:aldehyde dehydrogenase family protein [Prauserella flavalba]PXY38025.1 aldehyde dehydrogenase [Prauserella flavalba]
MDAITPQPRAAWVAGRAEHGAGTFAVTHPCDDTEVATVALPDSDQVERAVASAAGAAATLRRSPAHARATALEDIAKGLATRAGELAELITAECGKPLRWAEVEVAHAVAALRSSAREATRADGELHRLDSDVAGEQRMELVRRRPRGPVLGAVPAHCPLGVAAHTVAAALAVGAPVVLAPDTRAPLGALALGEVLAEADLPEGAFSVLPFEARKGTARLATDPRFAVTYAGATGTTTAVVLADWPDLGAAARRIAASATQEAGQGAHAVRTVVVEAAVADDFVAALTDAMRAQPTGDPFDPAVSVGPLATADAATRFAEWLDEVTSGGAKLLTGSATEPTLLRGPVAAEPVPGPVLVVSVADSADAAFELAEGARTGVFTRDVTLALRASAELAADTAVIGDVPAYRPDSVRATMREFGVERVTVLTGVPL